MRNLYLVLTVLLVISIHNNFISEKPELSRIPASTKEVFSEFKNNNRYVFNYNYLGEKLTIEKSGQDSISSFKEASKECFKHFYKKSNGLKKNGEEIIDICSNPR